MTMKAAESREGKRSLSTEDEEGAAKRNKKQYPKITGKKDVFCWTCHRPGNVAVCSECPRAYHLKCGHLEKIPASGEKWVCPECDTIQRADKQAPQSAAHKTTFSKLLGFVLDRVKLVPGVENFSSPVDTNKWNDYLDYVIHPMDLPKLKSNVEAHKYRSVESFLADFRWLVHASYVYNSVHSVYTKIAKSMMTVAKQECEEVKNCSECFMHACSLPESWFVEPCTTPHVLVWAQLSGFPYWPGKVMRQLSGDLVDVRFFGDHTRANVPASCCFLYSRMSPNSTKSKKHNSKMTNGIEEAETYVKKLEEKYKKFCYAQYRVQYLPKEEECMRKLQLPQFPSSNETPAFLARVEALRAENMLEDKAFHSEIKKMLTSQEKSKRPSSAMKRKSLDGAPKFLEMKRKLVKIDTPKGQKLAILNVSGSESDSSPKRKTNPLATPTNPGSTEKVETNGDLNSNKTPTKVDDDAIKEVLARSPKELATLCEKMSPATQKDSGIIETLSRKLLTPPKKSLVNGTDKIGLMTRRLSQRLSAQENSVQLGSDTDHGLVIASNDSPPEKDPEKPEFVPGPELTKTTASQPIKILLKRQAAGIAKQQILVRKTYIPEDQCQKIPVTPKMDKKTIIIQRALTQSAPEAKEIQRSALGVRRSKRSIARELAGLKRISLSAIPLPSVEDVSSELVDAVSTSSKAIRQLQVSEPDAGGPEVNSESDRLVGNVPSALPESLPGEETTEKCRIPPKNAATDIEPSYAESHGVLSKNRNEMPAESGADPGIETPLIDSASLQTSGEASIREETTPPCEAPEVLSSNGTDKPVVSTDGAPYSVATITQAHSSPHPGPPLEVSQNAVRTETSHEEGSSEGLPTVADDIIEKPVERAVHGSAGYPPSNTDSPEPCSAATLPAAPKAPPRTVVSVPKPLPQEIKEEACDEPESQAEVQNETSVDSAEVEEPVTTAGALLPNAGDEEDIPVPSVEKDTVNGNNNDNEAQRRSETSGKKLDGESCTPPSLDMLDGDLSHLYQDLEPAEEEDESDEPMSDKLTPEESEVNAEESLGMAVDEIGAGSQSGQTDATQDNVEKELRSDDGKSKTIDDDVCIVDDAGQESCDPVPKPHVERLLPVESQSSDSVILIGEQTGSSVESNENVEGQPTLASNVLSADTVAKPNEDSPAERDVSTPKDLSMEVDEVDVAPNTGGSQDTPPGPVDAGGSQDTRPEPVYTGGSQDTPPGPVDTGGSQDTPPEPMPGAKPLSPPQREPGEAATQEAPQPSPSTSSKDEHHQCTCVMCHVAHPGESFDKIVEESASSARMSLIEMPLPYEDLSEGEWELGPSRRQSVELKRNIVVVPRKSTDSADSIPVSKTPRPLPGLVTLTRDVVHRAPSLEPKNVDNNSFVQIASSMSLRGSVLDQMTGKTPNPKKPDAEEGSAAQGGSEPKKTPHNPTTMPLPIPVIKPDPDAEETPLVPADQAQLQVPRPTIKVKRMSSLLERPPPSPSPKKPDGSQSTMPKFNMVPPFEPKKTLADVKKLIESKSQFISAKLKKDIFTLFEQIQHEYDSHMELLERIADASLNTVESTLESNKNLVFEEMKIRLRNQVDAHVAEVKKKQWCILCGNEAAFHCCWGYNYCCEDCQKNDWAEHTKVCTQYNMTATDPHIRASPRFQALLEKQVLSGKKIMVQDLIDLPVAVSVQSKPSPPKGRKILAGPRTSLEGDALMEEANTPTIPASKASPTFQRLTDQVTSFKIGQPGRTVRIINGPRRMPQVVPKPPAGKPLARPLVISSATDLSQFTNRLTAVGKFNSVKVPPTIEVTRTPSTSTSGVQRKVAGRVVQSQPKTFLRVMDEQEVASILRRNHLSDY